MNITNKGKKWELMNSLWILWSFTLLFACIGFFWIGARVGKRKWIISGLVYLILNLGFIYISQWLRDTNAVVADALAVIIYISWLVAIVHAIMSRKEYLLRREAVVELKSATRDAYRNEIRKDYLGDKQKTVEQAPTLSTQQAPPIRHSEPPAQKVNLNTAAEQELANLPGVGVVLAKRALEMRAQNEAFASVQDFNQRLGLMPHFALQIENMAFIEQTMPQKSELSPENTGRVLDI